MTTTQRVISGYGWRPDMPDPRDKKFAEHAANVIEKAVNPPKFDLRIPFSVPDCYDQADEGSCTGNGVGFVWQFSRIKNGKPAPTPARNFIYYNERVIEGTVNQDNGAEIRDGMKTLAKQGCCDEALWPYNTKTFTKKPSADAYAAALKHVDSVYLSVAQKLSEIQTAVAAAFPVVMGFSVFQSFESAKVAKTGVVPLPGKKEALLGGHCVVIIGYDDSTKTFLCRNSWGTSWGMRGYFTVPYDYFLNPDLASDFWVNKTSSK